MRDDRFDGDKALAQSVCSLTKRRKISPARLSVGTASAARLRTLLRLWIPDEKNGEEIGSAVQPSDIELTVAALPEGLNLLETSVVAAIGPSGETLDCHASIYAKNRELTKPACDSLKTLTIAPMIGADGRPVPYVTVQKVRFTTAAATSPRAILPPAT